MTEVVHDRRHPLFEEKNTYAVTHGGWTLKDTDAEVQELVALYQAYATAEASSVPWLRDPTYSPVLSKWALVMRRIQRLQSRLHEHEDQCQGCEQCRAWDQQLWRWIGTATKLAGELGLTPASRARLLKDGTEAARTGFDLEQVKKAGAATQEREAS
jgi:hypothetical protein